MAGPARFEPQLLIFSQTNSIIFQIDFLQFRVFSWNFLKIDKVRNCELKTFQFFEQFSLII